MNFILTVVGDSAIFFKSRNSHMEVISYDEVKKKFSTSVSIQT